MGNALTAERKSQARVTDVEEAAAVIWWVKLEMDPVEGEMARSFANALAIPPVALDSISLN